MHEAFWNGLFDTRWEGAPLGREAIRLVQWLRERGYGERSRRAYAHAVVHLGRVLHEAPTDVAAGALDEAIIEGFIEQHLRSVVAINGGWVGNRSMCGVAWRTSSRCCAREVRFRFPINQADLPRAARGVLSVPAPRSRARRNDDHQLSALRARLPDQPGRRDRSR